MKYKAYFIALFILTICSGCVAVLFFNKNNIHLTILFLVVTAFLLNYSLRFIFKLFRDIDDFLEAIKARDFSKRYPVSRKVRNNYFKYFNAVSETFLSINLEKETQQQYLKKILELVNTGILAYNIDTYETLWMNNSFTNMFQIPYVKNINWLKQRHSQLYKELIDIPLGENRLVSINRGYRTVKMLSNACTFQTNEKTYQLIAFLNVSAALEDIESGAWKGLLNVMTHEIMNSIAPVASLADSLKKRMELLKKELELSKLTDLEDIESAMETIYRRSEGLLRFADSYRNLSKNIIPELQPVNLFELLKSISRLMQPSLELKGITLEVRTDNFIIVANLDRNLIEQVVINFITNATNAVKEKKEPKIILFSGITDENPYITVADNGCGIPPEIQEKMFIPFFSTKKNGTGIGLSLSREIVKLHNGNLQVQTKVGEGSAFTILFGGNVK